MTDNPNKPPDKPPAPPQQPPLENDIAAAARAGQDIMFVDPDDARIKAIQSKPPHLVVKVWLIDVEANTLGSVEFASTVHQVRERLALVGYGLARLQLQAGIIHEEVVRKAIADDLTEAKRQQQVLTPDPKKIGGAN